MTREEERRQFFEQNPVMRQMRRTQQQQEIAPDVVPTREQIAETEELDQAQALAETIEAPAIDAVEPVGFDRSHMTEEELEADTLGRRAEFVEPRTIDVPGRQLPRSPMTTQGIEEGFRMMAEGAALEAATQAEAEDFKAQAMHRAIDREHEANVRAQSEMERLQTRMNEYAERAIQLQDRLSEMNLDPDRFWNSRSTGQKAMLYIGAALSGFGGNTVQMIENAIDRDIQAQQINYQRLGDQSKNMIAIMSQLYKPGMEAIEMTRAWALDNIKNKLEAKFQSTKSAQLRASIPRLIGEINVKQGEILNNIARESLRIEMEMEEFRRLPSDMVDAIDMTQQAEEAANDMISALEAGQSPTAWLSGRIRDNDFTRAARRLQDAWMRTTGGSEEDFRAMLPRRFDSARVRRQKVEEIRRQIARRRQLLERATGEDLNPDQAAPFFRRR